MNEFFKNPNPPTYNEESAGHEMDRSRHARKLLEQQMRGLREPVAYLAQELRNKAVPTNTEVLTINHTQATAGKVALRKLLGGSTANPYVNSDTKARDRGWLISQSATREGGKHTITLLENGDLVIGEAAEDIGSGRHRVERLKDDPTKGNIRLLKYPAHPVFETQHGYASTYATIPSAAKGVDDGHKFFPHTSAEHHVGVNLDKLEADLRNSGRRLLGLASPGRS